MNIANLYFHITPTNIIPSPNYPQLNRYFDRHKKCANKIPIFSVVGGQGWQQGHRPVRVCRAVERTARRRGGRGQDQGGVHQARLRQERVHLQGRDARRYLRQLHRGQAGRG